MIKIKKTIACLNKLRKKTKKAFLDKRIVFVFFVLILVVSGIIFLIFNFYGQKNIRPENYIASKTETEKCPVKITEKIVQGNSLQGVVENGETIKAFFGYYNCNKIQRNDLVLYSFANEEAPLIKIARGIPGDEFKLKQKEGGWHILINDEILKNSENISYLISEQGHRMLSLYVNDFKGVIPQDVYLILSNLPQGGMDSAQFGLVHKTDILGKAVANRN